jgi:hypothetical protein
MGEGKMTTLERERLLCDQGPKATNVPIESAPTLTPYASPAGPTPDIRISSWAKSQLLPIIWVKENWDGYKANAPSPKAVLRAAELLTALEVVFGKIPPMVSPTRTGGILLIWERNGAELEIQIGVDESFSFVYEDASKEIHGAIPPLDNVTSFTLAILRFFGNSLTKV